ncbi:hypothetical protein WJX82_009950 [Trebouxia sp. C0006]
MLFRITQAPQSLMVHLKSTVSDEQNMSFKKRHQVEFPFVLDMTEYKWNSDQAAVYDLQGVIVHVGESVKEGHYYAVVRDGGAWWEFDDEKVTRRTAEDVLKEEAYLLSDILRNGSTADEFGSPLSTQSCDAFLDGERGSDHSAQEAVVEPEMPATAMAPNASGRHRPRSRLASVALPEPSGSYGLGSSDLTSLDQGLQEASQSGLVGPYSEMHQAAELPAAAQPVSNEAASLPDASHIAPTPIPHADHSLPAASQSRLGSQPHPKAPTAQSRRDSSMQTVPVATAHPANDLSSQAPARANTSAATAGNTGQPASNYTSSSRLRTSPDLMMG